MDNSTLDSTLRSLFPCLHNHNNEVWPYPFSTPCTTSGSELIRIVVVLHCCSYALPYTSREHTWIGAKWDRGVGRRAYMWKACIEGRASSTACASPVAMGGHHGCTGRRGANHTRVNCCSCRAGQGQCAHRCRCVPPSPSCAGGRFILSARSQRVTFVSATVIDGVKEC